ncbi:apolipoprotein D-like [Macrobrachium rosenbergii]|uniref:apolipoprotein D-like n=1 Tax=Macrobrachium rosenbergii TaxID=79674 RepID=UPI0034D3B2C1
MKLLLAVVVLGTILLGGSAHVFRMGSCKKFTAVQNFDPQKFNGTWYVIKKLATSSPCMRMTVITSPSNELTVEETRTPSVSQMLPVDTSVKIIGELTMDPNDKGNMKLKWKGNFMNSLYSTNFAILDTNYTTYALDIECQSVKGFSFIRRDSATIYSRTPTLAQDVIDMLEAQLVQYDIDVKRMSPIEQGNCKNPGDNDYNFVLSDKGVTQE